MAVLSLWDRKMVMPGLQFSFKPAKHEQNYIERKAFCIHNGIQGLFLTLIDT